MTVVPMDLLVVSEAQEGRDHQDQVVQPERLVPPVKMVHKEPLDQLVLREAVEAG